MRISVKNYTDYNTEDLKAILAIAAKRVGVRKPKTVIVTYSTVGETSVHGWGWVGDRKSESTAKKSAKLSTHRGNLPSVCAKVAWNVQLRMPKVGIKTPKEMAMSLAAVGAHEFMHNLGARHKDMTEEQRYCKNSWVDKWPELEGLSIGFTEPEVKVKESASDRGARLVETRESHARDMLAQAQARIAKAETQLKKANTIRKKWADKVKYYEKKSA